MSVNGITNQASYYESVLYSGSSVKKEDTTEKKEQTVSDSYEKSSDTQSDSSKQIYSKDSDQSAIIERMKADLTQRKQQLADLVNKTFGKQADKANSLSDLFNQIKSGAVSVDQSIVEQAKKDVADDGYWGVEQTSDRLAEFAKALSGGDTSKADEMIEAVKKGFKQATGAWGDKLPDISQKTLDATLKKLDNWKNGTEDKTEE